VVLAASAEVVLVEEEQVGAGNSILITSSLEKH